MTIAQRIELRRLGYTKEEINELAELEKKPVEEPEAPEPKPEVPEAPEQLEMNLEPDKTSNINDISHQLLFAINNLTSALQNQKLNQTAMPELKTETSEDIFNNILKG